MSTIFAIGFMVLSFILFAALIIVYHDKIEQEEKIKILQGEVKTLQKQVDNYVLWSKEVKKFCILSKEYAESNLKRFNVYI